MQRLTKEIYINKFIKKYNLNEKEIIFFKNCFDTFENIKWHKLRIHLERLKDGNVIFDNQLINRVQQILQLKRDSYSLGGHILRYGKQLGTKKFNKRKNECCVTKEKIIKKYGKKQANIMLKKRASASLSTYIDKYGIEDGNRRWIEYKNKRNKTLRENKLNGKYKGRSSLSHYQLLYGKRKGQKIFNDKINKLLISANKNRKSNIADELFNNIVTKIPIECEKIIKYENKRYQVDCYYDNKIIEFFGNYWHANPTKYNKNSIIIKYGKKKIFAHEIWKEDGKRIKNLKKKYKILIIWEEDYVNNKENVFNKCIKFLKKVDK